MHDATDMDLLRRFAAENSQRAFATLVERHVNLVYSAALRRTGNPHAAEEITQAVFIILAEKAGRISRQTILPGWLYQTTRLTAASFLRREFRRTRREQEAYMQSQSDEAHPGTTDETWRRLAPLLEDAMGHLGETDRAAVILRFFNGQSFAEIGTAFGLTENAAKKRVNRALEKLHRYFQRRGLSFTTANIAGSMATHSIHAASAGLAKTISAVVVLKGATATTSTLTLVKGALKIMAWSKTQTAIVTVAIIFCAVGSTTVIIGKIRPHHYNAKDFWETQWPTGLPAGQVIPGLNAPATAATDISHPVSPPQLCSISGLLNGCMQATGFHYLIETNVAAGAVEFGNTNVLNGTEWVAAVENILQTGTPGWWDSGNKRFRKENLVLIKIPDKKVVLVLPKDKAAKYE